MSTMKEIHTATIGTSLVWDEHEHEFIDLADGYESFRDMFYPTRAGESGIVWEDHRDAYVPDPKEYVTLAEWDKACDKAHRECVRDWDLITGDLAQVRQAARRKTAAAIELADRIRLAYAGGFSLRQIGMAAMMSHTNVAKIVGVDADLP